MASETETAQLIDGKGTAATIRAELKEEVEGLFAQYGKVRAGRARGAYPPHAPVPAPPAAWTGDCSHRQPPG